MRTNYYFLKLHYEILDDWKVGTLPDSLKWRFIQCLCVAGECQEDGLLPELNHFAYRIRQEPNALNSDMARLASNELVELVQLEDGTERWFVTNYMKRQEKISDAQKQRDYRARQRQKEMESLPDNYDTVTTPLRNVTQNRIEENKNRVDENERDNLKNAICTVTKINPLTLESIEERRIDNLFKAGYTAEQVDKCYGPNGYWFQADWRGKRGQLPTLKDILTTIGQAIEWTPSANGSGPSKNDQLELLLNLIGKYGRNRFKQAKPELEQAGLMLAIKGMGGWGHVCGMREKDIKFAFYEAVK